MPAPSCFDLTGWGIGLTGGGGHLGRAMGLGLAEAGAIVLIGGRRIDPLADVVREAQTRRVPGRIVAQTLDINSGPSLDAFVAAVEREAGRFDGWVNNAYSGGEPGACRDEPEALATGDIGPLLVATAEQIQQTLTRGVASNLLALQKAARAMLPRRKGSIVNIASMYGCVSPQPAAYQPAPQFHNPPAYGAAKAALIQLTRYAACHLAPHGIRVNAISPGPFPSSTVQEQGAFLRELEERVPLGRVGRPEELVGAVVFLLSDASSFVTGHNLLVDGGWTAW